MDRRRSYAWLVGLLLLPGPPAFAWNPHGHRVAAAFAYQRLKPAVRARADALLKLNPDAPRWVAGVTAHRALVAFMRASNWPDDIRENPEYVRDPPEMATQTPRLGYGDHHRHEHWHYINKPFSPDGSPVLPPAAVNVQTQIARLRRSLASPSTPDEQKSYDLVWLIHLVADVHQPLHTTARFSREQPQGDRGGTWILLSPDPKDHLHRFWDGAAFEDSADPQQARFTAQKLRAPRDQRVAVTDEAVWVDEGWREAQRSVYVPPVGPGAGPYTLDQAYRRRARQVARERLGLAGVRLARLLNDALK